MNRIDWPARRPSALQPRAWPRTTFRARAASLAQPERHCKVAVCIVAMVAWLSVAQTYGDIYNWQTGDIIPGTQGITPHGLSNLSGWNTPGHQLEFASLEFDLRGSSFADSDLNYANFEMANLGEFHNIATSFNGASVNFADFSLGILTGTDFSNASMNSANFSFGNLTGAVFGNSSIKSANFTAVTGFTASQLYSTASYSATDLSGIVLNSDDLTGWNFSNQNLTNADLGFSSLASATLTGAIIRGTTLNSSGLTASQLYSTASYVSGDLSGINLGTNDLTGWSFAGQNLTNANFGGATYYQCRLHGAIIKGAEFGYSTAGLSANQLYSTASYASGDLSSIDFAYDDLTGWNFANMNLTKAGLDVTTYFPQVATGFLGGFGRWLNGHIRRASGPGAGGSCVARVSELSRGPGRRPRQRWS